MLNRGIIRNLDKLGRVVIPSEMRDILDWSDHAPIEINLFGRYVILHRQNDLSHKLIHTNQDQPILKTLLQMMDEMTDDNLLFVLELAQHLKKMQ